MLRQIKLPKTFLRDLSFCFLSAFLLILAFPQTNIWIFAWGGLVPLFVVLDGKKMPAAFFFSYLTGVVFFLGTIYWFIHVTLLGMILLVLYFAFYFGLFGLGYFIFSKRSLVAKMFLLPSVWVALEFARGHLLTGFNWISLCQSQTKFLPIIQIADITGMFGVSFLIVMVNVLARELARTRFNILFGKPKREFVLGCALVFSFVILSLLYGLYRLQPEKKASSLTITVVQADIPQEMKWQPSAWPFIMAKHLTLTKAAAAQKPDLIIWPETAFPGFIWESPQLFEDLRAFVAEIKIPLLLGLVIQEEDRYYNSVVLISKDGEIIARHDKLHLVPFGEYVPLRKTFPVLTDIVPIGDFTAGKTWTIFPQGFSVLICFEDTVPEISRGFVKKGANLLVNMTNDAWFKDTKAPFLHMQAAVFRAVENRRTLIRAANTGVSCFIDRNGRVLNSVKDEQGKTTYVAGYKLENVSFENEKTFYTKYEDVFTYLCFGVILWGIVTRNKRNFAKKI